MTLAPGSSLGPYTLRAELGRGGMGVVYTAHDPRLDRQVAIKVLPPELTRDAKAKQRFLQEAKAASALDHPNICTIHEINETGDGQLYLVMAHYEGETLRDRIERGALLVDNAIDIATQVGRGLGEAHAAGIVHRDIKPANLLIAKSGVVKILDFGLAKLAGSEGVTQTGTTVGTVAYMSPEQARGEEVDHRTDIWSLGVVLYEMLSGQPPFQGDNLLRLADAIRSSEPTPLAGDLSCASSAVTRSLSKDAGQRYQAVADFLADLTSAEASSAPTSGSPELPSIAVLPFANMSADPEQEYFSDGLTAEIIADLSQIHGLKVISRTSVMQLKNTAKDVKTIGRELGVRYVLEGSVRKADTNLRITAQLIDARTDAHLWANKYDGTLDDVFAIQERLSRTIVDALKVTLTPREERRLAERPIEHPKAHECYLQATQEIYRLSEASLERALQLSQNGLDLIGENELLRATKGEAYVVQVLFGIKLDDAYVDRAQECADRVLDENPHSRVGVRLQAMIHYQRGERAAAARLFREVLADDPNDINALTWLISLYVRAGKASLARPLAEHLLDIDPLTPLNHGWPGMCDYLEGRGEETLLIASRRVYELAPDSPYGLFNYAWTLGLSHRTQEAVALFEQLSQAAPQHGLGRAAKFLRAALLQDRRALLGAVTPEFTRWAQQDDGPSMYMAEGFSMIRETDKALEWVENMVRLGGINYPLLSELDPYLHHVRQDPRFQRLLQHVKTDWDALDDEQVPASKPSSAG